MATLDDLSLDQLQALYAQKTDPNVAAIHSIESNSAPATANPVNPASGASGSMQTMASTARQPGFGVNPSNGTPIDNTRTGVQYYQALQQKYKDPTLAAIAYDWGPGNADKWIAAGADINKLPLETLKYVQQFQQKTGAGQQQAPAPNAPAAAQAQQPALPQPAVSEMNIAEEPAADTPPYTIPGRIEQGVMDTLGGGGRALTSALGWLQGKFGDTQGAAATNDTLQQAEEAQAARDREFALKAQQAGAKPGIDWARLGGQLVPSFLIPGGSAESMLGTAANGAAGGAIVGAAATPPGGSYLENAGRGAVFGGAGGAAVRALGQLFRGAAISPEAQALIDQGVTPTPGQMLGGAVNRAEEKVEALPIAGDAIIGARRAAINDMNRAAYQQVLEPMGQAAVDAAPTNVGRNAIEQVHRTISDAYDNLFPFLSFRMDPQFVQDMGQVTTQAARYLNPDNVRILNNAVDDAMIGPMRNIGQNGSAAGQELKDIETALGQKIDEFGGPNADVQSQRIADALTTIQASLRSALARQNPAQAQELNSLNQAWSRYAVLRNAANRVTNPENPILPSQLQQAVKQESNRQSLSAFGEGRGVMQGLSDPATQVLSDKYPNSGSAGRMMLNGLLVGGGSLLSPTTTAAVLAGSGLYGTRIGRQAMLAAIAQRPDLARQLGIGIQSLAPTAGILSGAAIPDIQKR